MEPLLPFWLVLKITDTKPCLTLQRLILHNTPTQYACAIRLRNTPTQYAYTIRPRNTPTQYVYAICLRNTPTQYAYAICLHNTPTHHTKIIRILQKLSTNLSVIMEFSIMISRSPDFFTGHEPGPRKAEQRYKKGRGSAPSLIPYCTVQWHGH